MIHCRYICSIFRYFVFYSNVIVMYFVYLLQSISDEKKTYIGCTQGINRRLEQHNGIRSGGARRTRTHQLWSVVCFVSGFESKEDTLRFEYMWSHLGNLQNLTPQRRRLAAQFTVLGRILYSEDFIKIVLQRRLRNST